MTSVIVILVAALFGNPAAQTNSTSGYRLLDLLVFGGDAGVELKVGLPQSVRKSLTAYLARRARFRTRLPRYAPGPEMAMVRDAHVRYEKMLASSSSDSRSPALAAEYVAALQPCYEWEGDHECPEAEVLFASEYLASAPHGPFAAFLPLLIAHRWICTAEGYGAEGRQEEAGRC